MKSATKNIFSLMFLTASLVSVNAIAAPKLLYKDLTGHRILAPGAIPAAIVGVIKNEEVKKPDLYEVVVHKLDDHYELYLLSGKVWGLTRMRVELDDAGKVSRVIDNYQGVSKISRAAWEGEPACPDPSVRFLVISAYPGVGGVNEAIEMVSEAAKQKYKTMTILDTNADRATYLNWLSCPDLKGIYSIGHGSNEGIMVGNGDFINSEYFTSDQFTNKFKNTTVIINSCQVYNYPFGSEIMFGNDQLESDYIKNPGPNAYEYIGGHTNLMMFSSELSSACFMAKAISGEKMDFDHMRNCIGKEDMHYENFSMSHPGRYLVKG